jgi:threonine/homoserine/homoserine lactone efflux protein
MNAELFAAFVLIAIVLFVTPGPIVTLVIATGATQGVRAALTTVAEHEAPPPRGRVHFWRGVLVALSNPKTIVFFTAFLPQFIDPALPAERQLAAMCIVSVLLAASTDSAWAVAAGLGRAWFMKPARARLLGRLSGSVLIGGGIWLSLARRPG